MADTSAAQVANNAVDHLANGADKLFGVATELSTKLATVAEKSFPTVKGLSKYAWEILVRQQIIDGTMTLLWNAAMWSLVVIIYKIVVKKLIASKDSDVKGGGYAIAVIMSIIATIVTCCNVPNAISHILNPSYYAGLEVIAQLQSVLK